MTFEGNCGPLNFFKVLESLLVFGKARSAVVLDHYLEEQATKDTPLILDK